MWPPPLHLQLYMTFLSLTTLSQDKQYDKELTIGCEGFTSYFAEKVLMLHWDLLATIDTLRETESPCPSSGPVLDHVSPLTQQEVDKVLTAVKPTI